MNDQDDAARADRDQIQAGIKTTAEMAGEMFKRLRQEDMTRQEALSLTQTWLSAILRGSRGKEDE